MSIILIIDDDIDICNIIRRHLLLDGHNVYEAHDGGQGLKVLQDKSVDLVITDIFMPEMSGLNTIMKICSDFPQVKIIAISGVGANIDFLEMAKKLGAHIALKKPFTYEELSEAVQQLLLESLHDKRTYPTKQKKEHIKKNCWEVKQCDTPSNCIAFNEKLLDGIHGGKNAGRCCWVVAGTLCSGGKPSGKYAQKFDACEKCDFYHLVKKEEAANFSLAVPLILKLQEK